VLAADTTVADGERVLGKPADSAEARAMLRALRGRDHWVYTAIAVFEPATGQMATDLCATQVWMRDYSDAEIETYIASGDPLDKAGAYAIQHEQFHPVERIEGCYACVVGLAICRVVRTMRALGFAPPNDVTSGCQSGLGDACSVFPEGFGGQGSAAMKD
jgi:septum formation protein